MEFIFEKTFGYSLSVINAPNSPPINSETYGEEQCAKVH
jgi:hypothetical protein